MIVFVLLAVAANAAYMAPTYITVTETRMAPPRSIHILRALNEANDDGSFNYKYNPKHFHQ